MKKLELNNLNFFKSVYVNQKNIDSYMRRAVKDAYIAGLKDMEEERQKENGGEKLYRMEWKAIMSFEKERE